MRESILLVVIMDGSKKKENGSSEQDRRNIAIARPSGNADHHATVIAEAVDDTWHRVHGHGELEVPVSVVAVLAILAPHHQHRDEAAQEVVALEPDQFAALMRTQWAIYLNARPDLLNRAWPLMKPWHGDHPVRACELDAAKMVADTAVKQGQFHLTGDAELRREVDLLGKVVTLLRGRKAAESHGKFYTPASVTDTMARMLGGPQEGQSVHEPAAGTGGMLRAAAQAMRAHGRDPATVTWIAADVDELAIACLAVNVVLWDLGPRVLLGVGNVLTDEWKSRAQAERRETIELARQVRRDKNLVQALQDAEALIQQPSDGPDQQGPP
ncbi:N-6 DNA methylase [Haloactinospora alba]|uniref:N-6 DNA methylase n=1 Tax=Haloactinospora alba TaxID=405555 RepID=A0A543NLD0_9ACTN|nr:N-6 DNA methylase [Haloactinospora alba]TQN32655.1 N-6 DNA methylase [Haloactinospora alba]